MHNPARYLPTALAVAVFAALSLAAHGQSAQLNADIVKMIQAGLPEGAIVDKINSGAGHWDTSVDALIALKTTGATDAEIKALTALPAPPAPVVPAAPAVQNGVPVLGGTVINDHGHVSILLADEGKEVTPVNLLFHVVLVEGEPALQLDVESDKWGLTVFQCTDTHGDLIVTKDKTTFYPYARGHKTCNSGPWTVLDKRDPVSWTTNQVQPHGTKWGFGLTSLGKQGPALLFGNAYHGKKDHPPIPTEAFLNHVFNDFSGTMAAVLQGAGISDAPAQIAADAHYQLRSQDELAVLIDQHNKADEARVKAAEAEAVAHPKQGGGLLNGLVSTMAVVSAGTNVLQAAQSGNIAAQVEAQQAYAQTVAQALNGDSAGAAATATAAAANTPPPALPAPRASVLPAAQPHASVKTYTTPLNGGGTRKETIVTDASGSHITVQCIAPGASAPYESFTRSGPSEFFTNLPACAPPASTSAGNGNGTGTAKPPVPAKPAPAPVQPITIATNSNLCPPSGWIMIQNGDVAQGQQCTPGQPIGSTTSFSGNGGSGGSSSSGSGASSGSGSASGGGQYVPSLPISCISMDFNGNYHWDQYYNHCNQDISLTFVFPSGVQGTMDPIRMGGTSGTGHSQAEYQSNGGEPSLYICPAGDIPVNAQGTMVNRVGMQYRCKLP